MISCEKLSILHFTMFSLLIDMRLDYENIIFNDRWCAFQKT